MKRCNVLLYAFLFTISPHLLNAQWLKCTGVDINIRAIVSTGSDVFLGSLTWGVYRSQDNGITWTDFRTQSGLPSATINALLPFGTRLLAGSIDGIYMSINNGENWSEIDSGITNMKIICLQAIGSKLFAGTWGGGVFISDDTGKSWKPSNTGLTNLSIFSLAGDASIIFAGSMGGGVFRSTDNGQNWVEVNNGLTYIDMNISSLLVFGSNVLAGSTYRGSSMFLSTNKGDFWKVMNLGIPKGVSTGAIIKIDSTIYAGTDSGVYISKDTCQTWTAANTGLTIASVNDFAVHKNYLFAGTEGTGLWKLPISTIAVKHNVAFSNSFEDIKIRSTNSVNSNISITFTIKHNEFISINLNNLLGQNLFTLVNNRFLKGKHTLKLDLKNSLKGCYILSIQTESQRMIKSISLF